jgi:AraC-like DNA-binding protein/quercetin dioxygenase-like cupin family protein
MSNTGQAHHGWSVAEAPPTARPPDPLTVRAQRLLARSHFPEHAHSWAQVVYAISGVLTVAAPGRSFVISPQQAVWLAPETPHRVGSLHGAEFRSLWIAADVTKALPREPTVFSVGSLLRALIVEAADLEGRADEDGYSHRVASLILDQLRRASPIPVALPWPRSDLLGKLCEALYADPGDGRSAEDWGRALGMSSRTLTRRFQADVGVSLRSWRRRVRLFKAVEMLGGGMDVTRTALELGYGTPSAFSFAFRSGMGVSPQAYMRGERGSRSPSHQAEAPVGAGAPGAGAGARQ